MASLPVSIVVVPRERFSDSIASLESLYANTPVPCEMIYVDGNSPEPIKTEIEQWSAAKKFQLIRSENYLSPNQARNIGLARATNKYVVFVDNDLRFTPGWLERLVACAEETGASVVGPVYLEGRLEDQTIHAAGGPVRFVSREGKRAFLDAHRFSKEKLDSVRRHLRREPTEMIEFHALLVRAECFETVGLLDERLMSMSEHLDFSLSVRERGHLIYMEPASIVTYTTPTLSAFDVEYFQLRWGDSWTQLTIERLQEKWNLPADDPFLALQLSWARSHRRAALAASGFEESECAPATDGHVSLSVQSYIPPIRSTNQVQSASTNGSEDWSTCAQTVVQLFNQLYASGYTNEERSLIGNAYQQAMRLFTGQFRPSGKTFISHLVGVASILVKLSVDAELVVAGLLHAVYEYGDFGGAVSLDKKRTIVRNIVGVSIEQLLDTYHALKLDDGTIPDLSLRFDQLDQTTRNVLLVRLANELEEALDLSIVYSGYHKYDSYVTRMTRYNEYLSQMAERLGFPVLAEQLSRIPKMISVMPRRVFDELDLDRSFPVLPQPRTDNSKVWMPQ